MFWVLLLLLIVVLVIMWVVALIDLLRADFKDSDKVVWVLLIIFLPFLGSILYLAMGKNQEGQTPIDRLQSNEKAIELCFASFFVFSICMTLWQTVIVLSYTFRGEYGWGWKTWLVTIVFSVVWTYIFYLLAKAHRPFLVYCMLIALVVMLFQSVMESHYSDVAASMDNQARLDFLVMVYLPVRICDKASPLYLGAENVIESCRPFVSEERVGNMWTTFFTSVALQCVLHVMAMVIAVLSLIFRRKPE